jgi:hypothetical protein
LLSIVSGCDSLTGATDESGWIIVYNLDDEHEYRVELYVSGDNTFVDSCYLDNYPDDGYADSFEGLVEESYYLSIFKDGGTNETGRSLVFHLDEYEGITFTIESDWNITNY